MTCSAWPISNLLIQYLLAAGRPYQLLRTYKESPTYPTGYAGMFVLSWIPPLWRMVMDPIALKAGVDYQNQLRDGSYTKLFRSAQTPRPPPTRSRARATTRRATPSMRRRVSMTTTRTVATSQPFGAADFSQAQAAGLGKLNTSRHRRPSR